MMAFPSEAPPVAGRAVEAAGGDQQRAAGVEVGVGGRLWVHHATRRATGTRSARRGAGDCPSSTPRSCRSAASRRSRPPAACRRPAPRRRCRPLIGPHDASVGGDVAVQEVSGGGDRPGCLRPVLGTAGRAASSAAGAPPQPRAGTTRDPPAPPRTTTHISHGPAHAATSAGSNGLRGRSARFLKRRPASGHRGSRRGRRRTRRC